MDLEPLGKSQSYNRGMAINKLDMNVALLVFF